jgi:oxygen-independent coproporphyrinogen III oxidase
MIGKDIGSDAASLYIHVPFCTKKCPYCHFFVLPDSEKNKNDFVEALLIEWSLRAPLLKEKTIVSIYFGGGTPSLLSSSHLETILAAFRSRVNLHQDCEITIEANPEHVSLKQMQSFQRIGINRVSLGVQTFDDALLKTLGRTHNSEQAIQAIDCVKQSGIHNISIDLMFELPHQTMQSWERSLQTVQDLPITHLSLYNLVFEQGTLFYKHQKSLSPYLPSEEDNLFMLQKAVSSLESYGLKRYEISAFAKQGYHSRHNTGYWIGRPFLGLGPSAFSYWDNKRSRNVAHLHKYIQSLQEEKLPEDFEETLAFEPRQKELMAVQLRLLEGVSLTDFQNKHGPLSPSLLSILRDIQQKGWAKQNENVFSLTEEGLLFYDSVATEII